MSRNNNINPKESVWGKLILPHPTINGVETRKRAQLSAALALGTGSLYILGAVGSYFGLGFSPNRIPELLAIGGLCFIAFILSRSKFSGLGIGLLVGVIAISAYFFVFIGTRNNAITLYGSITISLILGSALLPTWGFGSLVIGTALSTILLAVAVQSFSLLDAIISGCFFLVFGMLLFITTRMRNLVEHQRRMETTETNVTFQSPQTTLEQKVEERPGRTGMAAEEEHKITSTFSSNEVLERTVSLIVERFDYYHSSIYLLDEGGAYSTLRASAGEAAAELLNQLPRFRADESSIIGWVFINRKVYIIADTDLDEHNLSTKLLSGTKSEAGIPIIVGEQLVGVLDVQSQHTNAFDESAIASLQTLVEQTIATIQNYELVETSQTDLQNTSVIDKYGFQIAQATKEEEILLATRRALETAPFSAILLLAEESNFHIATHTLPENLPAVIEIKPVILDEYLTNTPLYGEVGNLSTIPEDLLLVLQRAGFSDLVIFPIRRDGTLRGVFVMGSRKKQPILPASVQPYANLADLAVSTLDRVRAEHNLGHQLKELGTIAVTSQALSTATDLESLFTVLHDHVRKNMGEISFLVALYEADTNSINIPYMYENIGGGEKASIESFPLGEGLTSILIRTKQPLMIVENTERRAAALGAIVTGKPAKSWLGTPLIVSNDVIGAIVVQDIEHENAFSENDLRFLTTLSAQVAGAINNIHLVEESRKRALQLQTAAEIARDISGLLDIGELLAKAVTLIRDRFDFYHAAVFLNDAVGEYAIVREATGDAGEQMKRSGHRLKIGSKSIVGYVTGNGEHLVVNATNRDATYLANPLLPDTRAEVAIPLKVGQRILGALDVQSAETYAFSPEDINVLRILADQLAIAVINSELFAETQEHLSQHRLLHHVTTAAASGTTLIEALNSAAQGLQVTLGGDRVAILLADRVRKVLMVEAIAGYSEEVQNVEIPFGDGITGWVALHQQPLRINDVTQDTRYIVVGSNVCSELAIPLTYRGELLGVLNVESDQIGAYNENDEELLGTLGGSLAAIIANARLLEQIRGQVDRERLLYEVTSKIRRSTDMQSIMSTTTNELSKALGAKRAHIQINIDSQSVDHSEQETGK
jgi:GAF domain-containing protein